MLLASATEEYEDELNEMIALPLETFTDRFMDINDGPYGEEGGDFNDVDP